MKYLTPREYPLGVVWDAPLQTRPRGNQGTTDRTKYKDLICAFDIETTRLLPEEQAIMYVWQLHIHEHCTIVGRTWEELSFVFHRISEELNEGERLVLFCHNLSYEFQFLQALHMWEESEVFATDTRKVVKAVWENYGLEFRCSYILTNMSLGNYLKNMGVEHQKLDGETFDYSKIRYPWTPLDEYEIQYALNDVVGLCEALQKQMRLDGDTFYTLPLTSTGYVRREAKHAMEQYSYTAVKRMQPTYEIYAMLREAFRGGNTHANRYFVAGEFDEITGVFSNRSIHNVKSADRSSSYPDVQCNCLFPMSEFHPVDKPTKEYIADLITVKKKAVLMRVKLTNVYLRDPYWGAPYIPIDKCEAVAGEVTDNGRILSADALIMSITDIDFKIIVWEYEFDIKILEAYYARYGKLPAPLTDLTKEYYRKKTQLKTPAGQETTEERELREYVYMRSKNKLNSVYGMQATDPIKPPHPFICGKWAENKKTEETEETEEKTEKLFHKGIRNSFMPYQWGVWVTAHARYALECGLRLAHGYTINGDLIPDSYYTNGRTRPEFIYADTDSVKYTGYIDWELFNKKARRNSIKNGACAADPKGAVHYMGVFENEAPKRSPESPLYGSDICYAEFKTMGAKKYAYKEEPNGETHTTIAGVNKSKGGAELDKHGGLKAFKTGFTFVDAGGTESVFNDAHKLTITSVERDGKQIPIYPNIVVRPSTYTLGLSKDYKRLLEGLEPQENSFKPY